MYADSDSLIQCIIMVSILLPRRLEKERIKKQHLPKLRAQFSDSFWQSMCKARNVIEKTFGIFFVDKFSRLGNWQGIGEHKFDKTSASFYEYWQLLYFRPSCFYYS
eukprot:27469_1